MTLWGEKPLPQRPAVILPSAEVAPGLHLLSARGLYSGLTSASSIVVCAKRSLGVDAITMFRGDALRCGCGSTFFN
jgi:hypothetical protein